MGAPGGDRALAETQPMKRRQYYKRPVKRHYGGEPAGRVRNATANSVAIIINARNTMWYLPCGKSLSSKRRRPASRDCRQHFARY